MPRVELLGAAGLLALAPRVVPLRFVAPRTAAAVWSADLILRALLALGGALSVLAYIPQTGLFATAASSCGLGVDGHALADAAMLVPALLLGVSLTWVLYGLGRGIIVLRAWLSGHELGPGPLGTTLIDDPEPIVAVTRMGSARVLLSSGALDALDDEELRASLAHEWGHVRRGHRPLLVAASVLAGIARWLPGTRRAARELALAIERDADAVAMRETGNPLALASAICKVALKGGRLPAVASLADGPIEARLDTILGHRKRPPARRLEVSARMLATLLVAASIAVATVVPTVAAAALTVAHPTTAACSG